MTTSAIVAPRVRPSAWTAVLVAATTEALALSLALVTMLRAHLPFLPVRQFVVTTVIAAGLAWAAGSTPALTSGDSVGSQDQPPLSLLLLAGAALGTVTGALLGAAQTSTFRRQVRHRSVWTIANTTGWGLAMAVIMVGASTPTARWPLVTVPCWAALTGGVAGTARCDARMVRTVDPGRGPS